MLEWTGERFIPGEGGTDIRYEHTHRYSAVRKLVSGLRVLDVGSGEGYGSAILAGTAREVVGVDIDAESVRHASTTHHSQPNLKYLHIQPGALPFENDEFDSIVCFEVIEHLASPESLLPELARVLKPSGSLFISTPNKRLYSDARNYRNEFHLREFYVDEFREFLRTEFRHVNFFAQRLLATSFIWNIDRPLAAQELNAVAEVVPTATGANSVSEIEPMYVVAVCSQAAPLVMPSSILTTADDALTHEMDGAVPYSKVRQLLDDMDDERARAQSTLDEWEAELEVRAKRIDALDADVRSLQLRLIEMSEELRHAKDKSS